MTNLTPIEGHFFSDIHIPVLSQELIEGLAVKPGGIYLDATLGRGGHSLSLIHI